MPRLSKEAKEARDALIVEWTERMYEALESLGKNNGNFTRRGELLGKLGTDFPENLYQNITTALQEQNRISKAGAERGKGSGWAVESLPSPVIQETSTAPKIKEKVEPKTVTIKVGGQYPHFARAVLLARSGVDSVIIVENEEEADYISNTLSAQTVRNWYWGFHKKG